jgi:hypothetical protein
MDCFLISSVLFQQNRLQLVNNVNDKTLTFKKFKPICHLHIPLGKIGSTISYFLVSANDLNHVIKTGEIWKNENYEI